jgi:enoyl-CoA hydratase
MAETAKLGDPHVKVGLVAGDGGTIAWPLAIGPMLAKRYLLTGDPIDAQEAMRLGLVAETTTDARSCQEAAMAWAQRLAAGAPLAIQYTKQAVNAWIKETTGSTFDLSTALEIATFASDDHAEALNALANKRNPSFTGR